MKRTVLMLLAIAAFGCEGSGRESAKTDSMDKSANTSVANTGNNERDRDMKNTRTPEDQWGEADRTITQRVRQGVVKEYGATAAAANVKIVTVDGVVTLRGPVNNKGEHSMIGTIAGKVDGVKRVDNQLEVASK